MSDDIDHNTPPTLMCCIYCGVKSREKHQWHFPKVGVLPVCKEHYEKLNKQYTAHDAMVKGLCKAIFGDD